MKNTFLVGPHWLISIRNKWPKDILFFSTTQ